jgi:hypothetical protein
MEKVYELRGCKISVVFMDKLIRIDQPKSLEQYLSLDLDNRTAILIKLIKTDYVHFANKELDITDDSMAVEIWGHVYTSRLAHALKRLIQLSLIENFADFVLKRSDVIDCGESNVDGNRKFWDALAHFKTIILSFLPSGVK